MSGAGPKNHFVTGKLRTFGLSHMFGWQPDTSVSWHSPLTLRRHAILHIMYIYIYIYVANPYPQQDLFTGNDGRWLMVILFISSRLVFSCAGNKPYLSNRISWNWTYTQSFLTVIRCLFQVCMFSRLFGSYSSDLSILEVIHYKQVRGFQQNRTVNTPWRQEVESKTH